MNGKIVYQDFNSIDIKELTQDISVKDWDSLVKAATSLLLPEVASSAIIYVDNAPMFRILFNGGIYDQKNMVWIVEETEFPEEVTSDMRFDEYDLDDDYEVRNGYMLLDPKYPEDGHIAVKLGDEIHEVGCLYDYMAPTYLMYDDGRIEDYDWIGLDDNYIREWYRTHKKHAQLANK